MRMGKLSALVAAAVLALTFVACGEEKIDTDQLEDVIAEDSNAGLAEVESGIAVESVSCPDDIPSETGEPFECTIAWDDDTTGTVTGEVTDGEAGDVEYSINPD
jgi:hypothetical protein